MSNSVHIPFQTPVTLEWRIFAKQLLDILGTLNIEWTRISDITSSVVWKILWYDKSYFEKFSDSTDWDEWEVYSQADADYGISIEWKGVNAKLVVRKYEPKWWGKTLVTV